MQVPRCEVPQKGPVRPTTPAGRPILRELCDQRGVELIEGKAMADHVHLCLSIPSKYSVAHTIGFRSGFTAICFRTADDGTALLVDRLLRQHGRSG